MDEEYLTQEKPGSQKGLSFSIRDIVQIIFKRKYLILLILFIALIMALVGYVIFPIILPPQYEASSTLLVKFGREFLKEAIYQPELSDTGQSSPFDRRSFIGSEIQILSSRELKEEIIKILGIENIYPKLLENKVDELSPSEIAILNLGENLSIDGIRSTDIIRVSFSHRDPIIAAKVVNTLVEAYQVKRLEVLTDPRTIRFLKKVLDEYSTKVNDSEEKLSLFKKKYGIYSPEEQKTNLMTQLTSIDTSLQETINRINELKKSIAFIEKQLQNTPKFLSAPIDEQGRGNQLISNLESKLLELRVKENELLQKYKETNKWVIGVRKEISLMEAMIEKEKSKDEASASAGQYSRNSILGPNPTYQQIEIDSITKNTELRALEVKKENLVQQRVEIYTNLQNIYSHDRQYSELVNELSENKKNYHILSKKYEEASISEQMDKQKMTSVSVIQKAKPPIKPVKESKGILIFMAGGIFLGLGSGVGIAVFIEYLSKVISLPEKAEKIFELPVIVSVPYVKNLQ